MKSADYFCSNLAHRQTDRQTNRRDGITSVLLEVNTAVSEFSCQNATTELEPKLGNTVARIIMLKLHGMIQARCAYAKTL